MPRKPKTLGERWTEERIARHKKLAGRSYDAQINRWTGKPHEHKREIARNLRK